MWKPEEPTIKNDSTTDNVYCFIEIKYNDETSEMVDVDGAWEEESQVSVVGDKVYSHSSSSTMTDVAV